MKMKLNI